MQSVSTLWHRVSSGTTSALGSLQAGVSALTLSMTWDSPMKDVVPTGGDGQGWWEGHPLAGIAAVVQLHDDTKFQLEVLFGILDRDGSGMLTQEDFLTAMPEKSAEKSATAVAEEALMQRDILIKWDALCSEFDFTSDRKISPTEFVHGMKRQALRLPLDPACARGGPDASHLTLLTLLTESVNRTIKNLCKDLFDYFTSSTKESQQALQRVQASTYLKLGNKNVPTPMPTNTEDQLAAAHVQLAALHFAMVEPQKRV